MLRYVLVVFAMACGGSSKSSSQPSVDELDTPIASERGISPPTSQRYIAAQLNTEGIRELEAGHPPLATKKLREAVARVPEARYLFNLCISLYREGRLDEAAVACGAVDKTDDSRTIAPRAAKALDHIKDEAKRRGLELHPVGGDAMPDLPPDPPPDEPTI